MSADLKLIESAPASRDRELILSHSRRLLDLTSRATNATSRAFVREMDSIIADAERAGKLVNLNAVADELSAEARPALPGEIKRQLQILIGSFPNATRQDLSLFGVALLEDVIADKPSIVALANACRRLRRSSRFVPTISEVLDALSEETRKQSALLTDVREFGPRIVDARKTLDEARQRIEQNFDRRVKFCMSRIRSEQSCEWFEDEVLAEARRRLTPPLDRGICAISNHRLSRPSRPFDPDQGAMSPGSVEFSR